MRHVARVGGSGTRQRIGRNAGSRAEGEFNEVWKEERVRNVPPPEAQARADEIVGAWDRHQAACEAMPTDTACLDAEVAYYGAVRARRSVAADIITARAPTLAGLAVCPDR